MRFGEIALHGWPITARQRFGETVVRRERNAAIVQRACMIRILLQGPVDPAHALGIIAALVKDHAAQMQAVEMIRPRCQDAAINPFRIRQSAGLVQLERFG